MGSIGHGINEALPDFIGVVSQVFTRVRPTGLYGFLMGCMTVLCGFTRFYRTV